jgi:hypothetical protein
MSPIHVAYAAARAVLFTKAKANLADRDAVK